MYKHRFKRMGGGGSYTHFYNLSLRKSHVLSPEGGLGGSFFWGGSHSFRQQSLRRTVEHLLPMRGKGNHK